MKIEKQNLTIKNEDGVIQSGIVYEFCDLGIGNIHGNLISLKSRRESDPISTSYTLTLEPQDILKLMTWLVGQEKHKEEISSSKPSWGPEIQDSKNPRIGNIGRLKFDDKYQDKVKQNQKIVDVLLHHYRNAHPTDYDLKSFVKEIIQEDTGKDIKDLEE